MFTNGASLAHDEGVARGLQSTVDLVPLVPLFRFVEAVAHQAACCAEDLRSPHVGGASHVGVTSGPEAVTSHALSPSEGQGAGRRTDRVPGSTAGHNAVAPLWLDLARQNAAPGAPGPLGAPAGGSRVVGQSGSGQGFPRVHVIDLDDEEVRVWRAVVPPRGFALIGAD